MASAQLSSPPRAGAGSDLRETAPAGHGVLLGEQHAGRRALAAPGHFSGRQPRPGRSVRPGSACTPAQPASPRATPRQSSPAAGLAEPLRPRPIPIRGRGLFGACQARISPSPLLSPGSNTAEWCGAWRVGARLVPAPEPPQKLRPSWAPGERGPARSQSPPSIQSAPGRPFLLAAEPGSLRASVLPAFQSVTKCISGEEKPGGARARTGAGPSEGWWLQAQAARPGHSERSEPVRANAPKAGGSRSPSQCGAAGAARPHVLRARGSRSYRTGYRPPAWLPPGVGAGAKHRRRPEEEPETLSPPDLGPWRPGEPGKREIPGGGAWKVQ